MEIQKIVQPLFTWSSGNESPSSNEATTALVLVSKDLKIDHLSFCCEPRRVTTSCTQSVPPLSVRGLRDCVGGLLGSGSRVAFTEHDAARTNG